MPFLPNCKFIENIVLVGKQKFQSISTFLILEVASHVSLLRYTTSTEKSYSSSVTKYVYFVSRHCLWVIPYPFLHNINFIKKLIRGIYKTAVSTKVL